MKTTIAGLIPNAPFFACIGTLLLAGVCLTPSGVQAAVDDWPATASAYSSDPLEIFAEEQIALMDLACRWEVQISLNQNGEAIVTPSMLVIDPDYPLNMYVVDIMGPLTNMVTCDNIGEELMAMVEELPTGNFCMSPLIIEDKLKPVLVCEDDTIPCNTDLQDLDILSFLDSVDDNCDEDPTVVYEYTITDLNCDPGGMAGYIDILYTATDDYGNSSTCEKRVWLEKYGLDEVEFPADTILNCDGADPDPEVIGGPTIGGLPIHHFCELVAWHTDNVIPMCSGQTKIIRLWRVMDWCTGEQISDPQEILIVDTVPPELECPADLTIGTAMLQCSSTYVFPDPDVTDVCSDDNLIVVRFTLNTVPGIFLPGQNVQLGLGPHIVTVSATDNCNNTATCQYTVTVVDDDDPVVVCSNLNITLNTMGMAFLNADSPAFNASDNCGVVSRLIRRMDDNCNTPANLVFGPQVKFCCEDVGEIVMVIFQAMDAAGNTATCMIQVTVKDGDPPVALCMDACLSLGPDGTVTLPVDSIDAGSSDNCEIVSRTLSETEFDCDDIGFHVVVLTVSDAQGNTATCTANVEIKDEVPPVAVCDDITVELNEMGMVTITVAQVDGGSSDNCGIDTMFLTQYDFDCDDVGTQEVDLIVIDAYGNSDTCTAQVTIDDMPPMVMCMDVTVSLDENGMVTITPDDVDGVSDDCSVPIREVVPDMFDCEDIGPNLVTLTATDNFGNTATCTAIVTVVDDMAPECSAMDLTIQLDADGSVTLAGDALDDGSTDNCEIISITIDPNTFTCDDTDAPVVVTQTVTDQSGNTSTCTALVTVEDNLDPICIAMDLTVLLDADGMVTISHNALDDGSSDNCGIESIILNQTDFDCDDVNGVIVVTQTVTDVNGNTSTCTAEVTVEDNLAPECLTMDITVFLDADGEASISNGDVDDGSNDNCGIESITVTPMTFDCEDAGSTVTVTQTVTDINGNTSTCTASVTVVDDIEPVCLVADLTIELGPGGTVTIDEDALDAGSTDNCEIVSYDLDQTTFDCDDIGVVVVIQTVTDASGNTATCSANVTVVDDTAPICIANDLTIELNMNGMASIDDDALDGGSTDNCGIMDFDLDQTSFDCDDVGVVVVTQTVTDFSGNTTTCTAEVTVEDNVAPECLTMDITVFLDENGEVSISNGDVDDGSNDACGIESITVTPMSFDCEDAGSTVIVTQTVTDENGNTSTCTASVTVFDDMEPICETMDITVELGPDGTVTIDSNAVDDGSSDNCEIVMISVDPNTFDCASDAVVVVIQTVTDASGNTSTCSANVTVMGGDEPEAICMDVTIYVDEEGEAFLLPEDIDGGSFSVCGMIELEVDPGLFECDMVGDNEATLTVTDITGSTATCTANVTVLDTLPPICLTQDVTVYLDENGEVSITVGDVDIGTTDNCGIDTIFLSQMDFTCADIGLNVIQKTAIDINGNMGIDSPSVTVLDTLPPLCLTQDITVEVNGGGMVTITPDQVDNGSTDNCPPVILDVEPSVFTCDDLGDNEVVLTVTDGSGNSSTCTAIVTVEDPAMLVANCQNLTVSLDANGMVVVDPVDVDNGSAGGCAAGMLEFDLSVTMFNCTDIGVNMVVLTVTDELGNTATCTALITVIDDLPPSIICPPDMTAACDDPIDIDDLSQFGNPTAFDNCPPVMVNEAVEDNRDDCGAGTIVRTFTATDPSGNTSQCVQTITVGDDDPFGEDDITWPPLVVMLGQCSSTDPGPGNQPVIDAGECAVISVDYEDVVEMLVDNDPNTPCIEITRTWTVIDSCQLEMGTQNGIFTFTQMIILNDNVGPVFTPLNDVTVDADTVTCEAFVMLVTSAEDCDMPTIVTNSYNGGGGNASDNYPIGTTIVVFTSTDDCGNVSTMEVEVHVLDPDPPTIMCHKIIRHMNEEFEVFVLAEEFVTFTPGSCTSMDDYLFSYSPTDPHDSLDFWGCQFAGTVEPVMIYTFDLDSMPIDTCRGDLDLRDTMDLCGQGITVMGEIFSELIHMMPEVPVLISEPSMTTEYTNDHGSYLYSDLDTGATYVLTPYLNAYHKLGVSTLDLVAIQKHLLGIRQLNSPFKMIAADANNSKSVTTLDLVEIRKLLLDMIPEFQYNTSWRFVDATYEFPDPVNPWAHAFPESIQIDSVIQHMMHKDFVGVKIGDVNNTAFLLHEEDVDVRSGNALVLSLENNRLAKGQVIEIPITVLQYSDLLGYQFTLEIDRTYAQFVDVQIPSGGFLSQEWFGMKHADGGILTTLWHETSPRSVTKGETLFSISVRVEADCHVSDIIRIHEHGLGSQAYDSAEKIIPVKVHVDGIVQGAEFALFQNVPNPFTEGTVIPVQVPEESTLRLEVYTSEGRLIHRDELLVGAGYHEVSIDAEVFDRGGVYYYTVSTGRFQATRKMILLD